MVPQDGGCPDYGEFVDSDGEGDVEDVSEPLGRYGQGLYYPLRIGEVLAGRYRIEHKLGWGGYSTVWMAHDVQYRKDVALKARRENTSIKMQNEILRNVRDTSHLVIHKDSFLPKPRLSCHAIAGGHSCISREAAARSIERPPRCWICASRYASTRNPRPGNLCFSD